MCPAACFETPTCCAQSRARVDQRMQLLVDGVDPPADGTRGRPWPAWRLTRADLRCGPFRLALLRGVALRCPAQIRRADSTPGWRGSREHLRRHGAVGIDQRIGQFAARLVEQVGDVQPSVRPGRWRSAPPCWARCCWRSAIRVVPGTRGITASGKFTELRTLPFSRKSRSVFGGHHRAVFLRLAGGCAQVRQGHDPRMVLQRIGGEIADIGVQVAAVERGDHGPSSTIPPRAKLSTTPPARISLRRAAFTRPRVASFSGTCTVTMSQRANRSSRHSACCDAGRQLPGALHGDLRVVAQHLHAQLRAHVRDLDADCPESYHAQRAACLAAVVRRRAGPEPRRPLCAL